MVELKSDRVTLPVCSRFDQGKISSHNGDMRRKNNSLLPIEAEILTAALSLQAKGVPEFHGYLVAGEIREQKGARLLTAYGTLYKALERMERVGLIESRWEDASVAEEGRPRRRLYQVTHGGERLLAEWASAKDGAQSVLVGRTAIP